MSRKIDNKGLTLIELIIVIAIMAILLGFLAPQLIRYVEKTNVSADVQLCDAIHSAMLYAMAAAKNAVNAIALITQKMMLMIWLQWIISKLFISWM